MSDSYSIEKIFYLLEKFAKEENLSDEVENILGFFCLWLSKKRYAIYNEKTEGVYDLKTQTIVSKDSDSDNPARDALHGLLIAFAKKAFNAKYYEDYTESEEMRRIMEYAISSEPDFFDVDKVKKGSL